MVEFVGCLDNLWIKSEFPRRSSQGSGNLTSIRRISTEFSLKVTILSGRSSIFWRPRIPRCSGRYLLAESLNLTSNFDSIWKLASKNPEILRNLENCFAFLSQNFANSYFLRSIAASLLKKPLSNTPIPFHDWTIRDSSIKKSDK